MSYMNRPHSKELTQSLKDHGLGTTRPSQLSDAFRLGWWASEKELSKQRDELLEALKKLHARVLGASGMYGDYYLSPDFDSVSEAIANAEK